MNHQDNSTEVLISGRICEIFVDVTRAIWPGQYCYTLSTADRTGGISWEEVSDTTWPDPDQAFAAGIARAEQRLFPKAPSPDETDGRILPEMLPLKGDETLIVSDKQRIVPVREYSGLMADDLTKSERFRLVCARMHYELDDIAALAALAFLGMLLFMLPGIMFHSLLLFWLGVVAAIVLPLVMITMDWYNEYQRWHTGY